MIQKTKVVSWSKTVKANGKQGSQVDFPIVGIGVSALLYPELTEDAREVLRTLIKTKATDFHPQRGLVLGTHPTLPHA